MSSRDNPFSSSSGKNDQLPILTDAQIKALTAVQVKYMDTLMSYPNVVGVGIGFAKEGQTPTNKPAVVVMVSEKLPMAQLAEEDVLPRELDGIRIDVQETGGFFAGL